MNYLPNSPQVVRVLFDQAGDVVSQLSDGRIEWKRGDNRALFDRLDELPFTWVRARK